MERNNEDFTPSENDLSPEDNTEYSGDDSYLDEFGSPSEVSDDYSDSISPEDYSPSYEDSAWDIESALEDTEFDDTVFDSNVASLHDERDNIFEDGDAVGGGYYDNDNDSEDIDQEEGFSPLAILAMALTGLLLTGVLAFAGWKFLGNSDDETNAETSTTTSATSSLNNNAGGTSPALPPGIAQPGEGSNTDANNNSTSDNANSTSTSGEIVI